jgi:hypothetical protein
MDARGLYFDMVQRQMTAHEDADATTFSMKP